MPSELWCVIAGSGNEIESPETFRFSATQLDLKKKEASK
jgi:hypothetical protein